MTPHPKFRLYSLLVIFVLVALIASSCAPTKSTTDVPQLTTAEVQSATEPPKALKVGLLTHGPVHDQGWNSSAYDGLMLVKEKLGAEVSFAELGDPSSYEKGFSDFASQGFDVVIGHGYAFNAPAMAVGSSYPETLFLTSGGDQAGSNVAPIVFREEQPSYLMGLIGGLMSKTHKGTGVGGQEIPSVAMPLTGFKAGFESVPGNQFTITYINSWSDIATAKEASLAAIASGTDVLVHVADLAGQGVIQAADEKGVWAFGTNSDQSSLAPKVVIASSIYDYGSAFLSAINAWQSGTFEGGKPFVIGLDNEDACNFVYNKALEDQIPADVKAKVEEARKDIVSGKIVVPGGYAP
jgi:basic membrane lipoprotein Med (substrate-binding protein (PBP1-ABC) superfamily)